MKINYVNADHAHALIDLPTAFSIEKVIQLVKGSSSHWINSHDIVTGKFAWGRGYGAFSVSQSNVSRVARYIADHDGPPDWARSEPDQRRWMEILASADVLFCLPREATSDLLAICPQLKWLQGTSAGMGQPAQRLGLIESDVIVTTASGVHAGALSEFVGDDRSRAR